MSNLFYFNVMLAVEQFFSSDCGLCDPRIFAAGKLHHHKTRQNSGKVSDQLRGLTVIGNLILAQNFFVCVCDNVHSLIINLGLSFFFKICRHAHDNWPENQPDVAFARWVALTKHRSSHPLKDCSRKEHDSYEQVTQWGNSRECLGGRAMFDTYWRVHSPARSIWRRKFIIFDSSLLYLAYKFRHHCQNTRANYHTCWACSKTKNNLLVYQEKNNTAGRYHSVWLSDHSISSNDSKGRTALWSKNKMHH